MRILLRLSIAGLLGLPLSACGQSTVAPTSSADTTTTFGAPVDRGTLGNAKINEASGLVASRKNPDALWTHNDSGGQPTVYLIDEDGTTRFAGSLLGAKHRDWEDIAVGPGPVAGESYVYVGDIGDNNAQHTIKTIYRFVEPLVADSLSGDVIRSVDAIRFVYPDGPRDAETLLLDPLTKDLYVLSKRDKFVLVYRAAFPQNTTSIDTLELLGQLPREQVGILEQLVGGDVSADGKEVLLKSYVQVFYWRRANGQPSLFDLLQTEPTVLTYLPEPQGEAIGFAADGSGYFTLSEAQSGIEPHLYFYPREK